MPIRVLLIEDNPGDADLTRDTLETGPIRVELSVAIDGADALAQLQALSTAGAPLPELILLDLNLPKLDGSQILAALKCDPRLRRIPVVILTSSDAEGDVVKSYELGASCYIIKPVGLAAFQATVRSVEDFWLTVARLP